MKNRIIGAAVGTAGILLVLVLLVACGGKEAAPPKSAAADYTRHFVDQAIRRYEEKGREATLAYYSSDESRDGQWHIFIIDWREEVIAHPNPTRLGLHVNYWVGADANGYHFGPELLTATEDGKWVSYVYRNPNGRRIGSGPLELRNLWVVRHDSLLFGSGWNVNSDEFTQSFVAAGVEQFRLGGLERVAAYFARPETVFSGLASTMDYYNSVDTIEGAWFAFIANPDGIVVHSHDRSLLGRQVADLPGLADLEASNAGNWLETESFRFWVMEHDGWLFASGWHRHGLQN
ncbi:MAG: hypothetical protein F4W95_07240 [Chloroflexi bacterium]|nr:hypothetical protein [Chloroflexota bacterium]MYD48265.1 hypothetical protein [Chloroflexota bacterium]